MAPAVTFDPKSVLEIDGYLEPDVPAIAHRYNVFKNWKDTIDQYEGGYDKFTKGYERFGFNVGAGGDVTYREWAPNVKEAYLIGDFSKWLTSTRFPFVWWVAHRMAQMNGAGLLIQ
jgi:1,4-alpha-glucan branching enzyme